jgi:hypothetical protein
MKRTGGKWNPAESVAYFAASNGDTLEGAAPMHGHLLCAVNELEGDTRLRQFKGLLDGGSAVFLDSGVFNLANSHARAHNMRMDDALGLAPEEVDGFNELFERYVAIVREFGDRVWGYIEIDQGGKENKRRTRARLEALGLAPIPVYHPLNDGWDYFDELAQQYDRICFGNVVQADLPTRKRLAATAWERRRKYPHLWIHLLGLTPSELTNAVPSSSCDSSTFCNLLRWPDAFRAKVANKATWSLDNGMAYDLGSDPSSACGFRKARALAGYEAQMMERIWRGVLDSYRAVLGCDPRMTVTQ